ncbi:MAG: tetratricopeptide repeat protein [Verrucomicrobiia bacterium]
MTVSRTRLVGIALVIGAVTVWLYWPSVHGGFLKVDDGEYLRQSMRWNGLTWNAVKWSFTSTDPYYHPLPRLSHVLDYQIWGTNAAGHHATSVFLHALNATLVFGFLWTLLGATSLSTGERLTVALSVAAVFAIHPLQVESVAWMSGRTQLLCTTFCIGSIWAYAAGARRWVVWGLFVLAILSKPMAVSLPFIMLAVDFFPLRRHKQLGWGRLLWDKAVMIAIAALVGVATMITQPREGGPMALLAAVQLSVRVFRVFESLTFYFVKLIWPAHLSPDLSLGHPSVFASVVSVVMITAVVVMERRRMPMLAVAWGSYVMLVLPMRGLMVEGSQVVAMRYAYVAILPLLLVAGAAVVWLWRRSMVVARLALVGFLACELCAFAAGTRRLIPDWHSDETMHRATLVEFPDSEQANRALATELSDQGRASEALAYAQRGVEIAPQVCEAHVILGRVLRQLGRFQEAIGQDEQALRMNPNFAQAQYNFGVALVGMGKVPEAAEHFEQALQIKPDYAEAHVNLGAALVRMGKPADAIRHYEEALRIKPDFAEAHSNLGMALAQTGKIEEAIAHFEQALRIKPDFAEAHSNLGIALVQVGQVPEAIVHYEQALRIEPDFVEAHYNLGNALAQVGRVPEAIVQYQQALRIKPDFSEAQNALARLQGGQ